ncbi:signal peptidase I [Brassicibacter mesophilus]|jgi:signal peptidase I|uniref:signal peptidase I n=1 Tax=Brassicibacter mesophilus TaxID=745119 RepID=UPI003D1C9D8F
MSEGDNKIRKEIYEWIKSIALAVIIAVLIKTFLFNTTYVLGYSMYPTLHERDRLFTNKIVYMLGEPKKGDIVVLKAPDDPDKDYIKRVIGVSGDKVEIIDGKVYVNDEVLNEEYISEEAYTYTYEDSVWEVPEEYVFVLGDNRNKGASKDSRYLGLISIDSIKGKASYRYYPFDSRFGSLYK